MLPNAYKIALPLVLALLACSSAPPPASPETEASSPSGPNAAPAAPASETKAAPAAGPPSARVVAVTPSKESEPFSRAKIEFKNPGPKPCRFIGYKLLWGASSKTIELDGFTIPPGETRERSIRVHPNDGDLGALTVDSARVEVNADCGG
jgi:hypothetical protein